MTNKDTYSHSSERSTEKVLNQPNKNLPNRKFPSDDSNVGDNPVFPNKDDLIPVSDIDSEDDDDHSDEEVDQKVGSTQGGVYPYNINSNTSDDKNDNKRK